MNRHTSAASALILASIFLLAPLSSATHAQEVEAGFTPETALPSVPLPTRGVSNATSTVSAPLPSSTSIQRTGGIQTSTDLDKAPQGALETAAKAAERHQTPPAPTTSSTAASAPSETKYVAGMVFYGQARAYDGHSLLLDGNPLRLNGIEAPGLKQLCTTSSGTSWRCGQKAYERLAALVSRGKVKCVVTAPAGHGAAVKCSTVGVRDIGETMVFDGLAVPNRQSDGVYRSAASAAAGYRRGMWTGSFVDPAKWRSGQ